MPFRRPKDKKGRHFTFMVIPHDSGKDVVKFRSPSWLVCTSLCVLFLCIVIFASSIVYTANLSRRLVHYRATLEINKEQGKQIDYFAFESSKLRKAIEELLARDNELRRLLGLKRKELKIDLASVVMTKERADLSPGEEVGERIKVIRQDLFAYNEGVKGRKESLEELKKSVSYIRARYYHTPSVWPAYGRIVSGFGYRTRPWRGFHTGVDISAWYGSPIRVAAAGVVTHSGWYGGYGNTVKIDHGYGLVTLYGHNSKLAVSIGSKVRKGQIIAYAGASGLATGPHLHYEVRKYGRPINPWSYLNLNIFTASGIWHGAR